MEKTSSFKLAIIMMLFMASCSGGDQSISPEPVNPTPKPTPEASEIKLNLSLEAQTRASDTKFDSGDNIGLFVSYGSLASSDNYVTNKQFTYSSGVWSSNPKIYWKDTSTKANLYCYYPYASVSDPLGYTFSVKTDQSTTTNYKASDFIWGKVENVLPTNNAISISMKHMMSNLIITVKAGEGFTSSEFSSAPKSVTINGVKPAASVNLSSGSIVANGTATSITPYPSGSTFKAIIVPQALSGTNLLTVTVGSSTYQINRSFTFKASTIHNMEVTVNKTSGGSLNIQIEDWSIDPTTYKESVK